MNRCDDRAEALFATDFSERVRSHCLRTIEETTLRAKRQARARQHS